MTRDTLVERRIGTRCEAQQRVLAGSMKFQSWREVDAEIKRVEQEVIRSRAAIKGEG